MAFSVRSCEVRVSDIIANIFYYLYSYFATILYGEETPNLFLLP